MFSYFFRLVLLRVSQPSCIAFVYYTFYYCLLNFLFYMMLLSTRYLQDIIQICDYSSRFYYSIVYFLFICPFSIQCYSQIFISLTSFDFFVAFQPSRFSASASMHRYFVLWVFTSQFSLHLSYSSISFRAMYFISSLSFVIIA